MRIGIDIDGVVADTFHLLVNELNIFFSRDIQPRNVTSYDLREVYGIDAKQLEKFATASKIKLTDAPEPVPGALKCIDRLKNNDKVFFISARPQSLYTRTEAWLKKHKLDWDLLILLGRHDKADTCVKLQLDVLVEDNLQNALQVSDRDITVLLLDAPYNQGPLPSLVQRCRTWEEICTHIHVMSKV